MSDSPPDPNFNAEFNANFNPFASPSLDASKWTETGQTTPRTAEMLRQTRPWVIFISVLLFLASGLMILAGLFAVLAVTAGRMVSIQSLFLLVYVAIGVLYLVPAVFLMRYARRIGDFLADRSIHSLDSALEAQKSFWRFVGIVTAVVMVIYFVMMAVALLAVAARW